MIHKLEDSNVAQTYTNKPSRHYLQQWVQFVKKTVMNVLGRWETLCLVVGLLLGRAVILSDMAPFITPFFAAVFLLKPDKRLLAFVSLVVGASTVDLWQGLFAFSAIVVFVLVRAFVVKVIKKEEYQLLPYVVLLSTGMTRALFTYIQSGQWLITDTITALIEAGLSYLLTLIFLYSLPLIGSKIRKKTLKHEEMICFMILLASILTGTIGWAVYGVPVEQALSRYFILVFAYIGGAAVGSTVGVVLGLILSLANVTSLYQMSLLAFSGLLGGLLKEGKKPGVSVGLMIGTLLIGLYGNGYQQLTSTTLTSLAAVFLFLLTPKSVFKSIAIYVPGTQEYDSQQQQYMTKLRDVTAKRVEQFSSLFQALSNSFSHSSHSPDDHDSNHEVDLFLSQVTEKTCQTCFLKEQCWVKKFDQTYDYMTEMMSEMGETGAIQSPKLKREWRKHCVKPEQVIQAMQQQYDKYDEQQKLRQKVNDSRRLVAEQLFGVSQVMGDFADEIKRERDTHQQQEDQIIEKLRDIGLDIENVEIYNLEEGAVDIDMTIPSDYYGECDKIIAPILSDILNETIVVKNLTDSAFPNGYGQVTFGSAKAYVIDTGVAHTAKGGGWISGDNYTTFELGVGKYAVAISDGMGNGERAHVESQETLQLLSKVLKSGIDETIAIKSINSILSLRSTEEIFSTLDLALVDLQDAGVKFLKIGSHPSFIKRGQQVNMIEGSNLPMGIIQDFTDVEVVGDQLKAGDLLIMMSDGIFDGPKHVENKEIWMKRKIKEMETDEPQEIADLLLEEVIRTKGGEIDDDMTVVISRIEHHIPKWAAISTYTNGQPLSRKAQ
ncbi:stage II sporulation protein E [Tuberibacillus sp. Marseille-P3662]|uniref:stage II sporulation protein E n=1 Tax=Tuberibacillus sp. Marseille-P3662 TaxID=1965358 RepID=UPI000A1CC4C2|nr:stage II sporulation protein E [Tuberibacillus sp. Marseille-P3662]